MADALKNSFNADTVRAIARELHAAHPALDAERFVRRAARLGDLGLTERAKHVARVMRECLPEDIPAALDVITRSFGPALERAEGNGMTVFRYLPHAYFIAEHGMDHLDASMVATHALTQRFTGEFTIRPFIERHPEAMLAVLTRWASDPSEHVRRLVSEGTRPRLPWASRLKTFERDPAPIVSLLEKLRDDPSEYVRRSVANHLNDLTKTHSTLVLDLAARWSEGAPEARRRLLAHGLRTLVKGGHPAALAAVGAHAKARARVTGEVSPQRIHIGDALKVSVTVTNRERSDAHFVIDAAVHFVKSDGSARAKVFKLRAVTLGAGASVTVSRTISFKQHTTRTHHPGRHLVEARVNGVAVPLATVDVRAAK